MDSILNKLSEIEDAATRILQNAAEQKKALAEEMKLRTEAYDREMEEKHQQELRDEQETLRLEREEKLENLRESMTSQMDRMEMLFEKRHSELAQNIVTQIMEG